MASQDTTSAPKRRGKGFPSLSLDEAVKAIKNAGKYGRDHSLAGFAGYLGHDSTVSGPFRAKMASLKDWGLVDRPGGDQVQITELGHQIAHPSSPEQEHRLLQDAFFNAEPFAAIYNDSAKETDLSVEFLGNRAVTALGIAAQSKQRFADSFARSVVAAGLGGTSAKGSVRLLPPGAAPAPAEAGDLGGSGGAADDRLPAQAAGAGPAAPRRSPPALSPDSTPPTVHQLWPVRGGSVLFEVRLSDPLPSAAFAALAEAITKTEAFVETLGAPAEAADPSGEESRADAPE